MYNVTIFIEFIMQYRTDGLLSDRKVKLNSAYGHDSLVTKYWKTYVKIIRATNTGA